MDRLEHFFERHAHIVRVRVEQARGSVPRGVGTDMFVALGGLHGTIGGGQLEYMAIDAARAMLRSDEPVRRMNVPLGPEIGQCCGGRVELQLERLDPATRADALNADARERAAQPQVHVFGAGHVGRAIAGCLALLPVRASLVDSRRDELALCDAQVEHKLSVLPEVHIRAASPGSAFIVLTHDHALDFLLTSEALGRGDAAYVGMIGSATKRAKFTSFCKEHAPEIDTQHLICPIGAIGSADKRPEVIAAFVVAEVMTALTTAVIRHAQAAS